MRRFFGFCLLLLFAHTHTAQAGTTHATAVMEHDIPLFDQLSEQSEIAQHADQSSTKWLHKRDLICLTLNTYHEARGISWSEASLITHITLNRIKSHLWGNGACDTIYSTHPKIGQPGYAFSWTQDPAWKHVPREPAAWIRAEHIVAESLKSPDPTHNGLYYISRAMTPPSWTRHLYPMPNHNNYHVFYRGNEASPVEVAESAP